MFEKARKLVFTTVDRAISYYEAARGSYELSGRVYASGGMGVPQSLTLVSNEAGKRKGRGEGQTSVIGMKTLWGSLAVASQVVSIPCSNIYISSNCFSKSHWPLVS